MSGIELPISEEFMKLKVQETLGTLLGANVQIRENDPRLLSIRQELRSIFESTGKTSISESELADYVKRYYFRVQRA